MIYTVRELIEQLQEIAPDFMDKPVMVRTRDEEDKVVTHPLDRVDVHKIGDKEIVTLNFGRDW